MYNTVRRESSHVLRRPPRPSSATGAWRSTAAHYASKLFDSPPIYVCLLFRTEKLSHKSQVIGCVNHPPRITPRMDVLDSNFLLVNREAHCANKKYIYSYNEKILMVDWTLEIIVFYAMPHASQYSVLDGFQWFVMNGIFFGRNRESKTAAETIERLTTKLARLDGLARRCSCWRRMCYWSSCRGLVNTKNHSLVIFALLFLQKNKKKNSWIYRKHPTNRPRSKIENCQPTRISKKNLPFCTWQNTFTHRIYCEAIRFSFAFISLHNLKKTQ